MLIEIRVIRWKKFI